MQTRAFESILKAHPFFEGMKDEHIATLSGCASNEQFKKGQVIFRQGEDADRFYIIREGRIAVRIGAADRENITVQTLSAGDVLGWSWVFPPYLWFFDASALEDSRAIALDARCLRGKCEQDPALGYELMKRFSAIVISRLQATRIQMLDMFGPTRKP